MPSGSACPAASERKSQSSACAVVAAFPVEHGQVEQRRGVVGPQGERLAERLLGPGDVGLSVSREVEAEVVPGALGHAGPVASRRRELAGLAAGEVAERHQLLRVLARLLLGHLLGGEAPHGNRRARGPCAAGAARSRNAARIGLPVRLAVHRQPEQRRDRRLDVEDASPRPRSGLCRTRAPHAANTPSIRCQNARGRGIERAALAGSVGAPLEAVVGVDDQRRAVLLGPAHPLADQPVHERVVLVHGPAVPAEVFRRRRSPSSARRRTRRRGRRRRCPRGRPSSGPGGCGRRARARSATATRVAAIVRASAMTGFSSPWPLARARAISSTRHVDEARELGVGHAALARRDLLDARRRATPGRRRPPSAIPSKRIGLAWSDDEEALHLFGRVRAPTSPRRRPTAPTPRPRSRSRAPRASGPRSASSGPSRDPLPGSRGRGARPDRRPVASVVQTTGERIGMKDFSRAV